MPSAFPTSTDLRAYIESVGMDVPDTYDLGIAADSAVAEWERRTGWNPFEATGTATARTFNAPKFSTLDLCAACQSIESVEVDGTEYDVTDDWYTETDLTPGYIDHIVFRRSPGREPQSIVVTADWGRVGNAEIPQDAWNAVRMLGAMQFIQDLDLSLRGFDKIEQGPVKLTRGSSDASGNAGTLRSLAAQSDRIILAYSRRVLWD